MSGRRIRSTPRRRPRVDRVALLVEQLVMLGLPIPVAEFPFEPDRGAVGYRLDLAWPTVRVGVEFEGGLTTGTAAHSSVQNLLRDCRKASRLAELGWLLYRASAPSVDDGTVAQQIARGVAPAFAPPARSAYEHWRHLYAASARPIRPGGHTAAPRPIGGTQLALAHTSTAPAPR